MNRPMSVTIVAALLIFMGASAGYSTLKYYDDPIVFKAMEGRALSPSVQFAWTAVGVVILVGCGVMMLRGSGVAKLIYLIYSPIAIVANALLFGFSFSAIIGLIVFLIFAFFLTRPRAVEYFRG